MQLKNNLADVIKGLIVLIGLVFFAIAAIAAAFKLAVWLWERGAALCLAVHGTVIASGLLLYFLPDGWWSWVVGAPFVVWAVIVAVWALPLAWDMVKSWIQKILGVA